MFTKDQQNILPGSRAQANKKINEGKHRVKNDISQCNIK